MNGFFLFDNGLCLILLFRYGYNYYQNHLYLVISSPKFSFAQFISYQHIFHLFTSSYFTKMFITKRFFAWVAYDLHSSPKMGICFRKFSILERRGSVALTKEEH